MSNTLIVILGPTGVGKTKATLQIARNLGVSIINADSRQIFAEIPIGTAAPTPQQLRLVPHFFVGTHHLTDYFSASVYEQEVLDLLNRLFCKSKALLSGNKIALMSGGSMMYIDAVCKGIDDIPTVDAHTRAWMKKRLEQEGLPALVEELKHIDPQYYQIVDHHNPRRVVHALEICHSTGKTYSSFRTNTCKERPFRILKVGLILPRETLYGQINKRTEDMIENGLVDEAMKVYPFRHLNSLNTVGFKEMFDYLDGIATMPETLFRIQSATRRYARKQLTWFKKDPSIIWFDPNNIEEILNYIITNA